MKSKMLADLQICISVPLRISGEKICITAFITIAEISFFFVEPWKYLSCTFLLL